MFPTTESVHVTGHYRFTCVAPSGEVKWTEDIDNLVTDTGKENYLKAALKGDATAQISTWYVGLIQGTTTAISLSTTDTSTSVSWTESTDYAAATRPKWNSGAVGSTATGTVSNSSQVASFSINAGTTLGGGFFGSSNTKGGTAYTLHSQSKFSQTRNPTSGDTIEVTIIQKTS